MTSVEIESASPNADLNGYLSFNGSISVGRSRSDEVIQWAAHDGEDYLVGYNPIEDTVIVEDRYREIPKTPRALLRTLISTPDVLHEDYDICQEVWGCSPDLITSLAVTLSDLRDRLGGKLADQDHGAILTRRWLGKRIVKSLVTPYRDANQEPQHVAIETVLSTVPSMKIALVNNSTAVELPPQLFSALDFIIRRKGMIVTYGSLASEIAKVGEDYTSLKNVRIAVRNLRVSLSESGIPAYDIIKNVHGYGYKLDTKAVEHD